LNEGDMLKTICSCGGEWPCKKRHWWAWWRHHEVLDIVDYIRQGVDQVRSREREMRILNGEK